MENAFFKLNDIYNQSFIVTNEIYNHFQLCSGDFNPLHTDDCFAKEKGFEGRVMHGNILNAFISLFVGEKLPTKDVIIHSQEIVFKNPVYMNEVLCFEATVSGIFESVHAVEFKYKFIKSDGKVAAKGLFQIGLLQ